MTFDMRKTTDTQTALYEIADILDEAGFVAKAAYARAALVEIERQAKRIAELKGAAKADEGRLIEAAKKAGIEYFGCDTPDHLADRVVELTKALVEERARHMPFFCECKEGPSCKKTWHDCKFDICPRKKELLDRAQEQLRQEGLL